MATCSDCRHWRRIEAGGRLGACSYPTRDWPEDTVESYRCAGHVPLPVVRVSNVTDPQPLTPEQLAGLRATLAGCRPDDVTRRLLANLDAAEQRFATLASAVRKAVDEAKHCDAYLVCGRLATHRDDHRPYARWCFSHGGEKAVRDQAATAFDEMNDTLLALEKPEVTRG